MRDELKRYSSIGDKAGILLFCRKILTGTEENIESIKTSCSFVNGTELNFICGLLAFESLELIRIDGENCIGDVLIYSEHSSDNDFIVHLCRYCFQKLIDFDLINYNAIYFNEQENCFLIPKKAFKLSISVFRNLLISLGALKTFGSSFKISTDYEDLFAKIISHKRKSQEQLLKELEEQALLGEAGELFAFEFEKSRKDFTSNQLKMIKRISQIDVTAGYDIISFEDELSTQRRFIEVKTFIGQPHFHWSRNEIETARLRASNYFLYLIDASQINNPDYIPTIIQNPYNTIRNSDEWLQEIDSILFRKI